ncbi:fibronectin type III domain-containing protein [Streptomyces albipurpureus]|uniref:Fibronectin type III domain-containing protein n=1 Tax=Streptomyces albipurpureus TaxID=2897419 RepID=A0ABT0V0Z1_9ACTN|nr:fibronectin type III domain-containing protein [Streptomyces sp. CWNU-1]MCM2393565.1 fibronectin type III domain-containing protein [Streptomyces sp. CWNU-1]
MGRLRVWVLLVAVLAVWLPAVPDGAGRTAYASAAPVGRAAEVEPVPVVTNLFPRDGAVDVQFVAGSADEEVTGFTVHATPGGARVKVKAEDRYARVPGLVNGTAYRFTVTQESADPQYVRTSRPSDAIAPRPAQVPLAPIVDRVHGRDGAIEVEWSPPDDGGSVLTGYEVTATDENDQEVTVKTGVGQTTARVPSLTNGTPYTVRVRARNEAGWGEAAERTGVKPAPDRVPGAPTDVSAAPHGAGDRAVVVRWSAPEDDGGPRITAYVVGIGGHFARVGGGAREAVITGLDPVGTYRMGVAAINEVGAGPVASTQQEVSPKVEVAEDIEVLTADSVDKLTEVETQELRFTRPNAQLRALRRGDTLVAAAGGEAPEGLLRKVVSTRTEGTTLIVTTQDAALPEVFDHAQVAAAGDLDSDRAGSTVYHQGVSPGPQIGRGEMSFGLAALVGPGGGGLAGDVSGTVRGTIVVDPHWEFTFTANDAGVQEMEFSAEAEVTASLQAEIDLSAAVVLSVPLAQTVLPPVTLLAGEVPIVIVPTLSLHLETALGGGLRVRADFTYAQTAGGRATYSGGSWDGENTTTAPRATADVSSVTGNISTQFSFPVEIDLQLYGIGGPGLQIAPYAKIVAAPAEDPAESVTVGVAGNLTVSIAGAEALGFRVPLGDISQEIYSKAGPRPGIYIDNPVRDLQPGQRAEFTLERVRWCEAPVTWSLAPGDPGTINQNGVYASTAFGGTARITATQEAYGECPRATAEAVVRAGHTGPTEPRLVSAFADVTDTDVTWTPPQYDGGDPHITYTIVLTLPGTRPYVLGTTTAGTFNTTKDIDLIHQSPGAYVQVIASNQYGISPPSPPADLGAF